MCTFCKSGTENLTHLFWDCTKVATFWRDFKNRYIDAGETFNSDTVFLGNDNELVCSLIFLGKRYINECRFNEKQPNILNFIPKVDYLRKMEFQIAKYSNRLDRWQDKWEQ